MKDYGKNKESSYLKYWNVNNLYKWAMSQKLPVTNFKWVEEKFEFNEDFLKSSNDDSDELYFIEVDIQYHEHLHNLNNDPTFMPERIKIEKVKKFVANLRQRVNMLHTREI